MPCEKQTVSSAGLEGEPQTGDTALGWGSCGCFAKGTQEGDTSLSPSCAHRGLGWSYPPPSVPLPRAQLWKPSSESIAGDQGMPGGQMKPLSPITFERESTRIGERGLQNQFEIYCVKGKKHHTTQEINF